uniref:Variant surface glycoprotein 1125.5635 n=1 Tax=Trypanosoma brucei TaxID=5691 RepID=A0A1J0RCY4_9TRYP|nr:variant surface glycoprotein 1125.5635 [Trypanosoma brucei]
MKFLFLPLLALALAAAPVLANVEAGDNAAEFHAVCHLIQLTEGEPQVPAPSAAYDQAIQTIQDMNMSIAQAAWQDMFKNDDGSDKQWNKRQAESKKDPADWAEQWPEWTAAAERVRKAAAGPSELKEKGFLSIPANLKELTKVRLETTLAKLKSLRQVADGQHKEAAKITPATIKAKLNNAIYGVLQGTSQYKVSAAGSDPKPKASQCNTGATAGGKSTLAHTLPCLCLTVNGEEAEQPCLKGRTLTNDWTALESNIKATYDDVRKYCPKG